MTTYGTIPTTSSSPLLSTNINYISRAKHRVRAGLGIRRSWKTMLDIRSFGLPAGLLQAWSRVRANVAYFRVNYAMVALFVLFLSLLWHPVSLIVFVVLMAVWLFLYFLRDQPLLLFNHVIDDRIVLIIMAMVTVAVLLLTDATVNILAAVAVGVVVVVVHAVFRETEDLILDEEGGGIANGGGVAS